MPLAAHLSLCFVVSFHSRDSNPHVIHHANYTSLGLFQHLCLTAIGETAGQSYTMQCRTAF